MRIVDGLKLGVMAHSSSKITQYFDTSIQEWLNNRPTEYRSRSDSDIDQCWNDLRMSIRCIRYRALRSVIDQYTTYYSNVPQALLLIIRWCVYYNKRYQFDHIPTHLPKSQTSNIGWVLLEHLNIIPSDISIIQKLGTEIEEMISNEFKDEIRTELNRELANIE